MKVAKVSIDKYIELVNQLGVELKEFQKTGYDTAYFLKVPKGVKVDIPISLVYTSEGEEQRVYNKVIVEEGAFLRLYTYCNSLNGGKHIGKTVAIVRGTLISAKIHTITPNSALVSLNNYFVEGGILRAYQISGKSEGESISRNKFFVKNGKVEEQIVYKQLNGKFSSTSKARLDNGNAILRSKLYLRNAIGKVVSILEGKGKGYSSCDAIVEENAEFITIPALKASKESEFYHEASIGKVDEEALLYLMSKGIEEERAKELYIRGFMLEGLTDLDDRLKFLIYSSFKL